MPAWPNTGKLLSEGFGNEPQSAVARTEMDSGPAKQRRVRGLVEHPRSCTYFMTSAERDTWLAWFRDDIDRGAKWFDWPDPVSGNTVSARIVGGQYSDKPHRGTLQHWRVAFTLETLE